MKSFIVAFFFVACVFAAAPPPAAEKCLKESGVPDAVQAEWKGAMDADEYIKGNLSSN